MKHGLDCWRVRLRRLTKGGLCCSGYADPGLVRRLVVKFDLSSFTLLF